MFFSFMSKDNLGWGSGAEVFGFISLVYNHFPNRLIGFFCAVGIHPSGGAIISEQTWDKMHSESKLAYDVAYGKHITLKSGIFLG